MSSISPFQVPDVTTSGNSTNGMLTDGKVNFFDILGYKPNVGLNAAGAILYTIIALALTVRLLSKRGWYMLAMIIGAFAYGGAFAVRIWFRHNPVMLPFIIQQLLLLLSVRIHLVFSLLLYSILGQMARRLDASKFLPISPGKVATFFVLSDVATMAAQFAGSIISGDEDPAKAKNGRDVLLGALVAQAISFIVFVLFYLRLVILIRSRAPEIWVGRPKKFSIALCISCIGIIIRSIYRLAEYLPNSSLSTKEVYLLILDSMPLALAAGNFICFWPEVYLPQLGEILANNIQLDTISDGRGRTPYKRL